MTPTDPGSAGELHVAVTGDITNLLAALNEVTSEAEKTGNEIAASMNKGGESFEEFSERMRAGIGPASQFSDAAQSIIDKQAELQHEFQTSAQALVEIQDAYANGTASALDLARAQQEMEAAMERAVPTLHQTTEATNEATGGLKEMAEQLVLLGEALVITEGLKELAQEALEVYSKVEQLTQSLTFFTGSSVEAAEDVEKLKEVAVQTHTPFEQLAADMQRMGPALGGFEKALPLFESASVAAHTLGIEFDGMVSKLDKIAISGIASSRVLSTLQLTVHDLDQATQALNLGDKFKDLTNVGERVEVLNSVLSKFSGDAALYADTLKARWTDLANAFDFAMDDMGKALAPLAKDLIDVFKTSILPVITSVIEQFGALPEPVQRAAVVFGVLVAAIVPLTAGAAALLLAVNAVTGVLPALTGMLEALGVAATETAVQETAAATATEALGVAAEGAKVGMGGLVGTLVEFAPMLLGAGAAIIATQIQIQELEQRYKSLDEEIRTHQIIDALNTGKTIAELKELGFSLDEVKKALGGVKDKIDETKLSTDGFGLGIKMVAASAEDWSKAAQKVVDEQAKANEKVKEARQAVAELTQALKDGYPVSLELQRAQVELHKAIEDLTPHIKAAKEAHDAHAAAMEKAREKAFALLDPISLLRGHFKELNDVAAMMADSLVNVNGKMILAAGGTAELDAATGMMVLKLHDAESATHDVADAFIYLDGQMQNAKTLMDEVNASALQGMEAWNGIAQAAEAASVSITKASRAGKGGGGGSDMMSGSMLQGMGGSSMGAAGLLQLYAAMGAPDSVLDGLAAALGLHQTGNRQYETQQEYQARVNAIDPSGVGKQAMQSLEDAGLSAQAAAKALVDLEAQVGRTGKSLASLVNDYIQAMQDASKNAATALQNTAASAGSIPWVTFKQKVDDAGNAIATVAPQIASLGTITYNVNAHLEDLVKGVTNAEVAFGGAVAFGGSIAQATAVVGAAAQMAAQAAGIALAAIPRPVGAMSVPTPFMPSNTSFAAVPGGVSNASTLGSNPQGVSIYVTGNAITSQDSAQRLAATLVAALRNNAGLKLG